VKITQAPGSVPITVIFAGDDVFEGCSYNDDELGIIQENACGAYNGPVFANTSGPTVMTATIQLSAFVSQEADGSAIPIDPTSNLNFKFNISSSDGNATVALTGSPVYSNGTFTQSANVTIKTGQISSILDVSWTIGGDFTNINCDEQESVVTVAVPGSDYSAGGGYLILGSNSGGTKKGLAGTKNNFGYNIKWAKNYSKLTGNFNTIWRQAGKAFQAKSNSASALIISRILNTTPARYKAQITYSNVNMKQIDCLTGCWSDGNGTVILTVYDYGEPGSTGTVTTKDQIGIAVKDKNGVLIYSTNTYTPSNPDPTAVLPIDGGNIQVRTSTVKSAELPEGSIVLITEESVCDIFIPNGFSPNGDGMNDYFQVNCIEKYPDAKLLIYSGTGALVYEQQHYGNVDFWGSNDAAWWNGRQRNSENKVALGTYIYILDLDHGRKDMIKTGSVFLSY